MKPLPWLAGGLLYLAFLCATAPASTLFWLANHLALPGITAGATDGTLWHGEARDLDFAPQEGKNIRLERFAWKIRPFRLMLGQFPLEFEIQGAETHGRGVLHLSRSGLDIGQLEITLPASWLERAHPGLAIFRLEGALTLRSSKVSLRQHDYRGHGEIFWDQAAFGMSPVKPVGSYRGEIQAGGEHIQFRLHTTNGPLQLSGNGSWSETSGIHFTGTAAAPGRESELAPVLRLLGKPDQNGSYALNL